MAEDRGGRTQGAKTGQTTEDKNQLLTTPYCARQQISGGFREIEKGQQSHGRDKRQETRQGKQRTGNRRGTRPGKLGGQREELVLLEYKDGSVKRKGKERKQEKGREEGFIYMNGAPSAKTQKP